MSDYCWAQTLTTPDFNEVTCDLPEGHDGKHADLQEGWEW